MFCKKGVCKDFAKFTGKHLFWSFFYNKIEGLQPVTLWKREYGTCIFQWNLQNLSEPIFCRTSPEDCFCCLKSTLGWSDLNKETFIGTKGLFWRNLKNQQAFANIYKLGTMNVKYFKLLSFQHYKFLMVSIYLGIFVRRFDVS